MDLAWYSLTDLFQSVRDYRLVSSFLAILRKNVYFWRIFVIYKYECPIAVFAKLPRVSSEDEGQGVLYLFRR